MQQQNGPSKYHSALVKGVALACVAGLHLAVLGALALAPGKTELLMEDSGTIQFVEISSELIDTAPQDNPAEELVEEAEVIEPQPEPEPEVIEPEPVPEPEVPELEELPVEKQEDAISEPKPEPKPEPPPKPKPKPVPPPAPKPVPKPQPASKPAPAPAAPSGASAQVTPPKAPPAPDPDKPRIVGSVDYVGRRPMPDYPRASQRRGEKGRVVVRVLISTKGTVDSASVRSSSGYDRLDRSALVAARKARFRPYTENGVAYPALADIPFDFVL